MGKLIIGCDADGVLTDLSSFNIREGKKYFKKEPVNKNAYSSKDMFGVSSKQNFMFGLKVYTKYCTKELPRENAKEVIQKLNEEKCELHEITARMFTTNKGLIGNIYRKLFEKWCKKHSMNFKSFEYCSEDYSPRDKLIACKKLNVDVMVEDKPDVALYLAENNTKVILFDAPYNKELKHKNIVRVTNWLEVYEKVQEIKSQLNSNDKFTKLEIEDKLKLSDEEKKQYFKNYHNYLKNLEINENALKKGNRRFKLIYKLAYLPIKIRFNPKVIGKENVPYQDGFIVASNHLNSFDQYIIGYALGNRAMTGFAASTIENTFRGKLFNYTKSAVFIDRTDKESKKNGEEEISKRIIHGQTALIFPEGTRKNKDDEGKQQQQLPFKFGTVSIAQKTGTGIIPISLYYGKKKYVKIGQIQFINPEDDLIKANEKLENTILNMTLKSMEEDKVKKKILKK